MWLRKKVPVHWIISSNPTSSGTIRHSIKYVLPKGWWWWFDSSFKLITFFSLKFRRTTASWRSHWMRLIDTHSSTLPLRWLHNLWIKFLFKKKVFELGFYYLKKYVLVVKPCSVFGQKRLFVLKRLEPLYVKRFTKILPII